ncbi:AI-2E family transporter [Psychroflexus halocasei]|uniref:Predicted PurR-regulated permease PerM n=1 Tax=Psychroflexus halocasei TaxID=908615 RepID=A0A1H4AR33_9FLAO|nr:AI-2E family transporter [Psychroflexus halocasei]SEA38316.1 Predicted PurR-regulated permease PerM [Psychroflexus halocasei]
MKSLSPKLVRQLFILFLIISLGSLIFKEIIPYLSGILGAITFYVLLRRVMKKMTNRGINESISVTILLVSSFILILLPFLGVAWMLSTKISKVVSNSEKLVNALNSQIAEIEKLTDYQIAASLDPSTITSWLTQNLQGFAGSTFEIFIAISIMYFLLYYMLLNQEKLSSSLETYIPIGTDNLLLIAKESGEKVKANAIGIPLVALFQGLISLIGFWIFGVPEPFFWFVITAIGSMIPFIGTAIGIIPATVLLFYQGDAAAAVGMIIYGFVIVGSSDNLVRLYVLKRMADEHPLITLIGVVIGVPLFGFIGLIFGPLLLSLFFLIVKIYKKEYGEIENKKQKKELNEDLPEESVPEQKEQ